MSVTSETGIVPHLRQGAELALQCPTVTEYEHMPRTWSQDLKVGIPQFAQTIMDAGVRHAAQVVEQIRQENPAGMLIIDEELDEDGHRTADGKNAKEQSTWEAYTNPDITLVLRPRLGPRFEQLLSEHLGQGTYDTDRISEPAMVEFGPAMPNGLRAMRFIDVKSHRVTTGKSAPKLYPVSTLTQPGFAGETGPAIEQSGTLRSDDWAKLAHYYRHARTLGLADGDDSLWAGILDKDLVVTWSRLDRPTFLKFDDNAGKRRRHTALEIYDRGFSYGLRVAQNAMARDDNPTVARLHEPEWHSECADCPWREVCLRELRNFKGSGHITLLPGITPARARDMYELGAHSIAELAALSPDGHKKIAKYIYQARTSHTNTVCLAPGVTEANIPAGDIEYDFDYEATTGDGGIVYMRGVRTRRRQDDGTVDRASIRTDWFDNYSNTEDAEVAVFAAWWKFLTDAIADAHRAGITPRFYHYSGFESSTDVKLAEKHAGRDGIPDVQAVKDFYASELTVDLYKLLPAQMLWPTMSHSIKKLAQHTGFSWRGDEIGGDLSMVWYSNIVNGTDPEERAAQLAVLREYNEDDVAAQAHLRDWVGQHGRQLLPVAELPTPGR